MLGDRNRRPDLLSELGRVAEEFVTQYLVKGYFNDLRDRKDGPLVPADQSEQDAAFAIGVELVFVCFLRQPVRPQASSRTQHGAQPDTVTSGSADAAARFQSKLLEELTDEVSVKMPFGARETSYISLPHLHVALGISLRPVIAISHYERRLHGRIRPEPFL